MADPADDLPTGTLALQADALETLAGFPRDDVATASFWMLERAVEPLAAAGMAFVCQGRRVAGTGTLSDLEPRDDPAALDAEAWPDGMALHPISAAGAQAALILDRRDRPAWTGAQQAWWQVFVRWFALAVEAADLHDQISRVRHESTHDFLTGLPNRKRLRAELAAQIEAVRTSGGRAALLLMDLDRFKDVNDALGHEVGDRLLKAVAHWLLEAVRDGDLVARLGGDEFVILMRDAAQRIEVALLARRLCEIIANGHQAIEAAVRVTASIGVALCPDHGTEVETLLKHADLATHDAKQAGRDTFRFWSPHRPPSAPNRLTLEAQLREAIDAHQLALVYQPQARLSDGSIAGLESLLRINHPRLGSVPPEALMAVAETSYVMAEISAWGLAETCRQALAWRDAGVFTGSVAVNVPAAAVQHARFPEWVADALKSSGLPAEALVIELTERSLVRNIGLAAEMLSRLGALGVRIGIDDFGVGHSALGYLNRLPVHKIKLDRSFVEGLPGDADSAAIVRNLVRMARELKLEVIAEGVETAEQADWLRQAGCETVQGYFIARPMRPTEVEAFLRERQHPREHWQSREH